MEVAFEGTAGQLGSATAAAEAAHWAAAWVPGVSPKLAVFAQVCERFGTVDPADPSDLTQAQLGAGVAVEGASDESPLQESPSADSPTCSRVFWSEGCSDIRGQLMLYP